MRISNKQFAEAIKTFREGGGTSETQQEIHNRIGVAAFFVMRRRRGISEDELFQVKPSEVADFLDGLSAKQIKKLKLIAEDLTPKGDVHFH